LGEIEIHASWVNWGAIGLGEHQPVVLVSLPEQEFFLDPASLVAF
jgi:hypothetical protein